MRAADIARSARQAPRGGRRTRSMPFTENPLLGLRLPMWRSKLLVFLLFGAFVSLAARAFWIQGPGNAFYEKEGKKRFQRTLELPATRGKVIDRNGLVLATSLSVKAIWAVPEDVPQNLAPAQLRALSRLLELPETELKRKLAEDKGFVYLKRQVMPEVAQQIAALKIPGIHDQREYKRFYPEGEAMAHVVGFTNIEDRGQEGIELAHERDLAGRAGARQVIRDRLGRVVEDIGTLIEPRQGVDMQLSIDSKIQYLAFNEVKAAVEKHKAAAGGAVVLDAKTGEVLALANWPTYNPNDRKRLSGEQLRNRVLTDTFEPGSTMKPVTIALALEEKKVRPDTLINTAPGRLPFGSHVISDTHDYGTLTVAGVIQKSSNVGTTKIAMTMQAQDMWEMYQKIGLGQAPKIGFPGAVAGRVRPYKSWKPIEQATMSYGYGLSASLFQLAHAYTIFARDGELIPISIAKVNGPVTGTQVISPQTARAVRQMLELAALPGGTAPQAQTMGYRVGGKTGTARKQEGKGYSRKYRAFFVGMAPMSDPRVIVAVMIDEPSAGSYYGGIVAAPVFSTIAGGALRSLNVAPDSTVQQLVVAEPVEESIE